MLKVAIPRLHQARISSSTGRLRCLDVGYGTGYWLYDMLDRYPHAQLVGIDMAPTVAEYPKPGQDLRCIAPVDFNQDEWYSDEGSYDLIHMSQLCGSVSDWKRLCSNALR